MYSRKEETSLEMAMSAAIAAVRTRNGNMTSEEVLKEAETNTKKKYPMLFEQPAESKPLLSRIIPILLRSILALVSR